VEIGLGLEAWRELDEERIHQAPHGAQRMLLGNAIFDGPGAKQDCLALVETTHRALAERVALTYTERDGMHVMILLLFQHPGLYAAVGRPSIPPEQLLRALLLQMLYTIRGERRLMEDSITACCTAGSSGSGRMMRYGCRRSRRIAIAC
jgi:hypothetical protein